MVNFGKLLLCCLVASLVLLLMFTSASSVVQALPKPSVPDFTISFVDFSYDVPPTYGIDQFTGKNVTVHEGHHVDNRTVVFKIRNQHFASYTDSNGSLIDLYYNFRGKGHFGEQWSWFPFSNEPTSSYPSTNGQSTWRYSAGYPSGFPAFSESNSDYTEFTFPLMFFHMESAPLGSELDFQVQAMIGHIDMITTGPIAGDGFFSFTGQFGDWSSTETTSFSTPNPTPPVPEFPLISVLPLLLVVPFAAIFLRRRVSAKVRWI